MNIRGINAEIKTWTDHIELDGNTIGQLLKTTSLPFIYNHIAVMPDAHLGLGSTVGTVIPTVKAVVPAAVGVDIGCGMMAVRTSLAADDMPDSLTNLRTEIESRVPHGGPGIKGSWEQDTYNDSDFKKVVEKNYKLLDASYKKLRKHSQIATNDKHKGLEQLGTLGGGNHFIEVCLDESNNVWIMLHSGSRGIGNRIGRYFIEKAIRSCDKAGVKLADKNLAYFMEDDKQFSDYMESVEWAQNYALVNRQCMMENVLHAIRSVIDKTFYATQEAVNCHHNYVTREIHFGKNLLITRKGAVNAERGKLGIIPGSMGAKSFIVRGKGNPESFNSCSHGAGRVLSRGKAKELISLEDHINDTKGVECRKDKNVLDESPKAYKNIDDVMKSQEDLVEIVHTLKQIVCVKG